MARFNRGIIIRGAEQGRKEGRDPYENSSTSGDGIARGWFQLSRNFQFSSSSPFLLCSKEEERRGGAWRKVLVEKMRERITRHAVHKIFLKEILSSRFSRVSRELDPTIYKVGYERRCRTRRFRGSTSFDRKVTRKKKLSSSRRSWITRDSNARARGRRGENRAVHVWKRRAMIQISARGGEKCRESSSLKGRITYGGRWFLSSSPPFTARLEAVVAWRGDCPVPFNGTRVKTSVETSTSRGRGENTNSFRIKEVGGRTLASLAPLHTLNLN